MCQNKFTLIFFAAILVHSSAAPMKRSLEDGTQVLPKRIKLIVPKRVMPEKNNVSKEHSDGQMSTGKRQPPFYCERGTCRYVTSDLRAITKHYDCHDQSASYMCEKCDFLGLTKASLRNHSNIAHVSKKNRASASEEDKKDFTHLLKQNGMFYCLEDSNCSYVTPHRKKIIKHSELHINQQGFSCEKCDYLGATERSVRNHNTMCHNVASSTSKESTRPIIEKTECGYCKMGVSNMDYHNKLYHTPSLNLPHFKCFPLILPKKPTKNDSVLILSDSESE